MNLRALYVSKLAKCPLICWDDLVGDRQGQLAVEVDRGGSRIAFLLLHRAQGPGQFDETRSIRSVTREFTFLLAGRFLRSFI
jgi:hypothetical protein